MAQNLKFRQRILTSSIGSRSRGSICIILLIKSLAFGAIKNGKSICPDKILSLRCSSDSARKSKINLTPEGIETSQHLE